MNSPKPSVAQLRVLRSLKNGLTADAHLSGRSEYGGLSGTIMVLRRRGWIETNQETVITDAGRAVLARWAPDC